MYLYCETRRRVAKASAF